uniref:TPR_REGION domain-containing protein n=1 Tax=Globodera pallida TaxID=36090 RepID=A0A183BZS8_GLOPA
MSSANNTSPSDQHEVVKELPMPDLDNSGVVTDQTDDLLLSMGDPDKEVGDGDVDRANQNKEAAMAAFNEGDYQKALDLLTLAITLNPGSAILHAKRANTLLKMSKMKAAIQDCDKAIKINPDSAQPYKFRGRANQLLGNWVKAHQDFAISCKLDYDDMTYGWMKEVESNAKKLMFPEGDPELLNAIKNDPSLIQNLMNIVGASGAPPAFADETGHEANSFGATTEGQDQGTTGNDSASPKKAPDLD